MGFLKNMFQSLVSRFDKNGATRDTAQAYDKLDKGGKLNYTPRSDRYSYDQRAETNYNKDWRPESKEELKSLSPKGFHRVKERAAEKAKLKDMGNGKQMDEGMFNEQYQEKQMSVDSTALENVQYDPVDKILSVKFQGNSKEYKYPRVPLEKVQGLLKAPSKGEYFMEQIHDQYTLNPGHKANGNKGKSGKYKSYFNTLTKQMYEAHKEREAMGDD